MAADFSSTKKVTDEIDTNKLPSEMPLGDLEPVAHFNSAMPTGLAVSHKDRRIFVNFPKWGDDVPFTVAEINGDGPPIPYPNAAFNQTNEQDLSASMVSVQSIVVDPADRLWIVDIESPEFKPTRYGGPKLVCFDLITNQIIKKFSFLKMLPYQLYIWMRCAFRFVTRQRRDCIYY